MDKLFCVGVLSALLVLAAAVPTGEELKRRRAPPKDLSDKEHYEGDGHDHNDDYDHEAFLGKEQAERFDQLSPEEAKRRLGIIVDKIDKDGDGKVTMDELKNWVKHVSMRYIYDDVERQWPYHDKNNDGVISWTEYKETAFGRVEDRDEMYDSHRGLTYNQMMERDEHRFKQADLDNDGNLNREEFADFLHPEEATHMRGIVIEETMLDMDKDKDGFVTLEEYINDIWPHYEREEGAEDPDWVKTEREQFGQHRDRDGNGKLDKEELAHWILPQDYDHAEAEARHLLYEADMDKDKVLTKEEILQHQDLFVGSQATDFGDYLVRHDEF